MISQQHAHHNECPINSRAMRDERYLRLIRTVSLTNAKFPETFAKLTPFVSEIDLPKARQVCVAPCADCCAERRPL